eukprot:1357379-Karenia_brevis.AAC.1
MMVQIAADCDGRQCVSKAHQWDDHYIKQLIQERRQEKSKDRRRALSKKIKKASRKIIRKWTDDRMSNILEEFSSLDRLSQIGIQRRLDDEMDRPSHEDFANMLQSVFKDSSYSSFEPALVDQIPNIPRFSIHELKYVLKKSKKKKTPDAAN